MTDIVSPTTGVTISKAPARRDIGIKRRYAAERRFQAYGIAAITFGAGHILASGATITSRNSGSIVLSDW